MTMVVNVHEAETTLSRLLDQAHAGQETVLTRAGVPYARLVPLALPAERRRPGRLACRIDPAFLDPLPVAELSAEKA